MSSLRDQVQLLHQDNAPTTFLDALRLVRNVKSLDAEDLQALMELHDAATTTDGAREVLADFLRGRAQSMAHERNQADRTLTILDSGKTVRGRKGGSIRVHLETRSHRGGIWEVMSKTDNITWEFVGLDDERRYTMGEIKLEKRGTARIELMEVLAPPKKSHARSQRPTDEVRVFNLEIAIEGAAKT
ncbi:MAG: hypothetical protein ACAI38_15545 [Myxococcota bacterium]|nr:hypothetical protein [Myxococcota bacterium]